MAGTSSLTMAATTGGLYCESTPVHGREVQNTNGEASHRALQNTHNSNDISWSPEAPRVPRSHEGERDADITHQPRVREVRSDRETPSHRPIRVGVTTRLSDTRGLFNA